jgi:hypothetical protein
MGSTHRNLSSLIVVAICMLILGVYPKTAICVYTLPWILGLLSFAWWFVHLATNGVPQTFKPRVRSGFSFCIFDILEPVVGESERDYGFFLPNPVFTSAGTFGNLIVSGGVPCVETSSPGFLVGLNKK